jgi:HSP20 family protein
MWTKGNPTMDDATKKVPAEAGKNEVETPEMFREWGLLDSLFSDLDRRLDPFRRRFWRSPFGRTVLDLEPLWHGEPGWAVKPVVDVVEKDKSYEIKAELPGIDAKNVELKVANGTLTIKGEKKEQKEEKKENYYLSERRFGSFQRSFAMPTGVDADKIEAAFSNGILTVTLPKSAEAIEREKKIAIKTS